MAGTPCGADAVAPYEVSLEVIASDRVDPIAHTSSGAGDIHGETDPLEYLSRDANVGLVYDEPPAYNGPESVAPEIFQRVIPQWWRGPGYPNQDDPNIASYSGPKAAVPSFFQVQLPMAHCKSTAQRDVALTAAAQGSIADLHSFADDASVPFAPAPMPLWAFAGMARTFNLTKFLRTLPKADWEPVAYPKGAEPWFVQNLRRRGLLRTEPKEGPGFEGMQKLAEEGSEGAFDVANLLITRALGGQPKAMQDLTSLLTQGTGRTEVLEFIIRRAHRYPGKNPQFALDILKIASRSANAEVRQAAKRALAAPRSTQVPKTPKTPSTRSGG